MMIPAAVSLFSSLEKHCNITILPSNLSTQQGVTLSQSELPYTMQDVFLLVILLH